MDVKGNTESRPKKLYRGITIPYRDLENFQFEGVDLLPPEPPEIDEKGRKTVLDGNEYGVYMSTNLILAQVYGRQKDWRTGSAMGKTQFGINREMITSPKIGIIYEIETEGMDIREPWIEMFSNNNGFEGREWISDCVPASNYSIQEVSLGADTLHSMEIIPSSDITKIKEIIIQKYEQRMERLKLLKEELEKIPLVERLSMSGRKEIERLKEFYKLGGKMDEHVQRLGQETMEQQENVSKIDSVTKSINQQMRQTQRTTEEKE